MKFRLIAAATIMIITAAFRGTAADSVTDVPTHTVTDLLNIDLRVRADLQNLWQDGHTDDGNSGFEGKYLMVRLDGRIVPGLTYSWRQRFNKSTFDSSFFDSTDWLNLTYTSHGFDVSAGKQIVAIGGWEYDRHPVDIYSASLFWMNVGCYQWGVSAGWQASARDHLTLQVGQSMFHSGGQRNIYSYNLLWSGQHGIWKPLYSVNLTEYAKGKYINYLMLGNHFSLPGNVSVELDLMNRYAARQKFLLRDCTVIGEFAWRISPAWRIYAKYTYDVNHSGTDADLLVLNGTELNMAGGGLEFYPLRKAKTSLRLHANCFVSWGSNTNTADLMQNKSLILSFGVTWDMHVLNLK